MSAELIGIDVGGTNFRLGVVQELRVVWEKRFQADFSGVCRRQSAADALETITATLNDACLSGFHRHLPDVVFRDFTE